MIAEQAIKEFLLTKTEITSLVGQRINYGVLPQGPSYPYITFFRYSNPFNNDINLAHTYLQIDIWSLTYTGAVKLAKVLRDTINREKRVISGIGIKQISYENEGYVYEPDTKLHHIDVSFKILYFEN